MINYSWCSLPKEVINYMNRYLPFSAEKTDGCTIERGFFPIVSELYHEKKDEKFKKMYDIIWYGDRDGMTMTKDDAAEFLMELEPYYCKYANIPSTGFDFGVDTSMRDAAAYLSDDDLVEI